MNTGLWSALERAATVAVVAASVVFIGFSISDRLYAGRPVVSAPKVKSVRPAPPLPKDPVAIGTAPVKGNRKATVAILEYSDFQCPFCVRFAKEVLPELDRKYLSTSDVLMAFKFMPLEKIHPLALDDAVLATCAGADQFWRLHDALFAAPKATPASTVAAGIGIDPLRLTTCMGGDGLARVRSDQKEAMALGVTGTPTFFVGTVDDGRRIRVAQRLNGVKTVDDFAAALEPLIVSQASSRK